MPSVARALPGVWRPAAEPSTGGLAPLRLVPPTARNPGGAVLITQLPGEVNLHLYRGDSFALEVVAEDDEGIPVDLSGMEVHAQIRYSHDTSPPLGEFLPWIYGAAVRLDLTAATSAGLPPAAVWDVQVTDQFGTVATLATGTITVDPDVTRLFGDEPPEEE